MRNQKNAKLSGTLNNEHVSSPPTCFILKSLGMAQLSFSALILEVFIEKVIFEMIAINRSNFS